MKDIKMNVSNFKWVASKPDKFFVGIFMTGTVNQTKSY